MSAGISSWQADTSRRKSNNVQKRKEKNVWSQPSGRCSIWKQVFSHLLVGLHLRSPVYWSLILNYYHRYYLFIVFVAFTPHYDRARLSAIYWPLGVYCRRNFPLHTHCNIWDFCRWLTLSISIYVLWSNFKSFWINYLVWTGIWFVRA